MSTRRGFGAALRKLLHYDRLCYAPLRGRFHKLTCYNHSFPMADIRHFQALRYNLQRVAPSQVVTQPYDKITPAMQEHYYAASPYNLVRIILGRRDPSDNTVENVYSRAAFYARDWRK